MESSPDNVASPALSPDNDEYVQVLNDYDLFAAEAAKRFEVFAKADVRFKELQDELHRLLVKGDQLWEHASSSVRGSSANKKAVSELGEVTDRVSRVLAKQAKCVEELDSSAGKVARGFGRLAEVTSTLVSESALVKKAVEERIAEMTAARPGIREKTTTTDTVAQTTTAPTTTRSKSPPRSAAPPSLRR